MRWARAGWAVLVAPIRGFEWPPDGLHRQLHSARGAAEQMQIRRGGSTPVGLDVVALWALVDSAMEGLLGFRARPGAVGVLGTGAGVERAAVLAASEPRVDAVLLEERSGPFGLAEAETAGGRTCACAYLSQGSTIGSTWRELAACRPGRRPEQRAALLRAEVVEGQEDEAEAEWGRFFATALHAPLGGEPSNVPLDAVLSSRIDAQFGGDLAAAWAWDRSVQGPAPWRVRSPVPAGAARVLLRMELPEVVVGASQLRGQPLQWQLSSASEVGAGGGTDGESAKGRAWVVAEDPARPLGAGLLPGDIRAQLSLQSIAAPAAEALRAGAEHPPPLGVATADLLGLAAALRGTDGVDPGRLGWLGSGSSAVPTLWAALFTGEGGAVRLVDAPVTLWGRPVPPPAPAPWPPGLWVLGPGGASLDPWHAAAALGERVEWIRPRGADGALWTGILPPGNRRVDVGATSPP